MIRHVTQRHVTSPPLSGGRGSSWLGLGTLCVYQGASLGDTVIFRQISSKLIRDTITQMRIDKFV